MRAPLISKPCSHLAEGIVPGLAHRRQGKRAELDYLLHRQGGGEAEGEDVGGGRIPSWTESRAV